MQGSVRGDARLTISSGDEHDSMFIVDCLGRFPPPRFHIRRRPSVNGVSPT